MLRVNERMMLADGWVGTALGVVIVRAGRANGLDFPAEVLRRRAYKFEGAPCFVDHPGPADQGRPGGRSVRDLVGQIVRAKWDPIGQQIMGMLQLANGGRWVWDLARDLGRPPFLGLSADVWVAREGATVADIHQVNSVDVVIRPAAGGQFMAEQTHITERQRRRETEEGGYRM